MELTCIAQHSTTGDETKTTTYNDHNENKDGPTRAMNLFS
jgi:hypothetical protein